MKIKKGNIIMTKDQIFSDFHKFIQNRTTFSQDDMNEFVCDLAVYLSNSMIKKLISLANHTYKVKLELDDSIKLFERLIKG